MLQGLKKYLGSMVFPFRDNIDRAAKVGCNMSCSRVVLAETT